MNKLLLFDIDSTLIKGLSLHAQAFGYGFKKIYNVDARMDMITTDGMTDRQIIIEILKLKGMEEDQIKSRIEECMQTMAEHFNELMSQSDAQITILPGVTKLLEELNKRGHLIGLVTGNLEPIAYGKLGKIGLDHYFRVGGFGSDHHVTRSDLVKLAIKKSQDKFDFKFDNNVFVIGDTPKDVKAGIDAGVKTIGIATGLFSKEQLENSGADFALNNLEDTNKILEIID